MGGFFKRREPLLPSTKPAVARQVQPIQTVGMPNSTGPNCTACGLHTKVRSPRMKAHGLGGRKILLLGQAPGSEEDKQGEQFVGQTGQWFKQRLEGFGIDIDRDCWKINACACRTADKDGKNRPPTRKELQCCRPLVMKTIADLKPEHIWLLGKEAMESFWFYRFTKVSANMFRGLTIPDRETNAWVHPMFHPSYPMRGENDDHLQMVFNRDLRRVVDNLSLVWPPAYSTNHNQFVKILKQPGEIIDLLQSTLDDPPELLVFDFETTGIKPYSRPGEPKHKILCVSVCWNEHVSYAFPLEWDGRGRSFDIDDHLEIINLFCRVLQHPQIKKAGQNINFETVWSNHILSTDPEPWDWDTMNVTHIEDDRAGFTGLKLQAYVRWGVEDYEAAVRPYITAADEWGHNRLREAPLDTVLHYCGLDSLLEYWLVQEQKENLSLPENADLLRAYQDFTHNGIVALGHAHLRGIHTDEAFYHRELAVIKRQSSMLERKILSSIEAKEFQSRTGKLLKTPEQDTFSPDNLKILFFDQLGFPVTKFTKNDNDALDKEVLEGIDHPLATRIIKCRKLDKIKGFIDQFLRESFNCVMNPWFHLHRARSNRSACTNPNIQQVPVRDDQARYSTRKGIIARSRHQLSEKDYGSMEVRIIACRSECPTLIAYIIDPTTDMHRDQACELFKLPPGRVDKWIRFHSKNGWVFPQFYTSYYVSCARNLWPIVPTLTTTDGQNLLEHLKSKGIETYAKFEAHLKVCEQKFWDRFAAVKRFHERACQDYLRKGYVQMITGHRRGGYLDRGKVINTHIQGPAFMCLLWSFSEIDRIAMEEGWDSYQCAQIHDSDVVDLNPDEWSVVNPTQDRVMTHDVRERFPWIIVPLETETEVAPIGASWFDKAEVNGEGVCIKKPSDDRAHWVGKKIVGSTMEELEN